MAAPKGNQYALGCTTNGLPPMYSDYREMQEKIEKFFSDCPFKKKVVTPKGMIEVPVITISGLAFYLGFASRQSFYDYEKKDDFAYTIKRARLFIEQEYEAQLNCGNPTGAIFALKNFGWSDKKEVEHSGSGLVVQVNTVNNNTIETG